VDGGEPRLLAKRGGQDWFGGVPAWSPDGKTIVCGAGTDSGGTRITLVEVPADGGPEKPITTHNWYGAIFRPTWLRDGSGLLVNGDEIINGTTQIWRVAYPSGEVSRLTNDLTDYGTMSFGLTADSSTIVTIASDANAKIWLASTAESEGRKLTDGKTDGQVGLSWTPDGRLVYIAKSGDYDDIWITNADGTGQKQLTSNADYEAEVYASPDGRTIFFTSLSQGGVPHIARIDMDGSNAKQLTQGTWTDFSPAASPDGKWLVFLSFRSGRGRIWKVSTDGGESVQLNDLAFQIKNFLPGGKLISGSYFDDQVKPTRWRGALISFETGQLVKVFDVPQQARFWWMNDEKTIIYSEDRDSVGNLWSMPVEGGTPKQLTKFTSDVIFNFRPSPDGKRFAVVRGTSSTEIILIKGF
jgi:Tol biopolymer transport system component